MSSTRQFRISRLGVLIFFLLFSCMLFAQVIPFQEDFREGFREQPPWYEVATTVHWEQNWVTWGSKYGKDESGGLLVQSIMRSVVVLLGSPVDTPALSGVSRYTVEADVMLTPKEQAKTGILVQGGFEPWSSNIYKYLDINPEVYPTGNVYHYNGVCFLISHSSTTSLPNNVYLVRRNKVGGLHTNLPGGDKLLTGTNFAIELNQWYHLQLDVEGNKFTGYINSNKVFEYSDTPDNSSNWPSYHTQYHTGILSFMDSRFINEDPDASNWWGDTTDYSNGHRSFFDNFQVHNTTSPVVNSAYSQEPLPNSKVCADIPTDEIGHWRFDEANGDTAHDASGHGLYGILAGPNGGAIRVSSGKFGGAAEFDGGEFINPAQHVVVYNTTAIDNLIRGNKITATCWFSMDDTTVNEQNPIAIYRNKDNWIHFRRLVRVAAGENRKWRLCQKLNGNADCKNTSNGNYTPNPNTWYHFVWTIDGSTHKLYIDNDCKATLHLSNPVSNIGDGANLYFGSMDGKWTPMDGWIDQVRIYNRVLGDAEIAKLYNESCMKPGIIGDFKK